MNVGGVGKEKMQRDDINVKGISRLSINPGPDCCLVIMIN
jgi:hypothetical protein